ncbi:MAG: hypothetical protein SGPRY_010538 [Prymnesium sp.]
MTARLLALALTALEVRALSHTPRGHWSASSVSVLPSHASRRALLAAFSGALVVADAHHAAAFSPSNPRVSELAADSIECRTPGCREAALKQLQPLLDVTSVEANIDGVASEHDLEVLKCLSVLNPDEPERPVHVKVKVVAESVDIMDYISVIWLANKSTGDILSARAMSVEDEGAPTIKYDLFTTDKELLLLKNDVLVPRLYCTKHGLWEGSAFTLAQYLDTGGIDRFR